MPHRHTATIFRFLSAFGLLPVLACGYAAAEPVNICIDIRPHPPYSFPDHDGIIRVELVMAAERAGLTLAFHAAPSRRCQEELKIGESDAFGAAAISEPALQISEFPRRTNTVDKERALAVARTVVFRPKSAQKSTQSLWDGRDFSKLHSRVLIPPGMILLSDRLQKMAVAFDDGANDMNQIAAKLLAGRAEAAIGLEYDVDELNKRPEFVGKFEKLPVPFTETEYYLVFSKQFYAAHKELAEAMWNAIGKTRHAPEFAAALRRKDLPVLETVNNEGHRDQAP